MILAQHNWASLLSCLLILSERSLILSVTPWALGRRQRCIRWCINSLISVEYKFWRKPAIICLLLAARMISLNFSTAAYSEHNYSSWKQCTLWTAIIHEQNNNSTWTTTIQTPQRITTQAQMDSTHTRMAKTSQLCLQRGRDLTKTILPAINIINLWWFYRTVYNVLSNSTSRFLLHTRETFIKTCSGKAFHL